jgi:hypothetical protein
VCSLLTNNEQANQTITSLVVASNDILDEGFEAICEALSCRRIIRSLNVEHNEIMKLPRSFTGFMMNLHKFEGQNPWISPPKEVMLRPWGIDVLTEIMRFWRNELPETKTQDTRRRNGPRTSFALVGWGASADKSNLKDANAVLEQDLQNQAQVIAEQAKELVRLRNATKAAKRVSVRLTSEGKQLVELRAQLEAAEKDRAQAVAEKDSLQLQLDLQGATQGTRQPSSACVVL